MNHKHAHSADLCLFSLEELEELNQCAKILTLILTNLRAIQCKTLKMKFNILKNMFICIFFFS